MLHDSFTPITLRLHQILGPGGLASLRLEVDSSTLADRPDERADLLFRAFGPDRSLRMAILVDILDPEDEPSPASWLVDLALTQQRLECPVFLVVIAFDDALAIRVDRAFEMGSATLRPLVLGPRQIPVITKPSEAEGMAELALVSGIVHARSPHAHAIGTTLARVLTVERPPQATQYWDMFLACVDEELRSRLPARFDDPIPRAGRPSVGSELRS